MAIEHISTHPQVQWDRIPGSQSTEDVNFGADPRTKSSCDNRWAKARAIVSEFRVIAISLPIFLVLFVALRHAHPAGMILYQGTAVGFFVSLAQFLIERRRRQGLAAAAKNALIAFLLIYSFVFTIPTTVDRAYSVKMLMQVGGSANGLTHDQIEDVYVDGLRGGGVDKRLVEQTSTGSISQHDGRYTLTPMGHFLSTSFYVTQVVFACQGKR